MPALHAQLACWCVWRVRFQHAQRHGRGAEQVFVSVCVHVCLQGGVCAWGTCHPESWVAVSLLHEVGMMGQFPFPSVGARRAPGSLSATLTCPVTSASFVGTERQGKDTVTLTCLVLSPSIVPPPKYSAVQQDKAPCPDRWASAPAGGLHKARAIAADYLGSSPAPRLGISRKFAFVSQGGSSSRCTVHTPQLPNGDSLRRYLLR